MINAYLADGYKKENILIFSPERLSEDLTEKTRVGSEPLKS